jgi:hypothetical protein
MALANYALAFDEWADRSNGDGWEVDENRKLRSKTLATSHPVRIHLHQVLRRRTRPRGELLWEHLPLELRNISEAIRASREILELEDEEGRPLCTEETWTRAVTFLAKNASWLFNERGRVIDAPRIWVGPNQSIDLHWDTRSYELLLNVRADPKQSAGFYGDDKAGKRHIKGTIDLSQFNDGLLLWLENYSGALA